MVKLLWNGVLEALYKHIWLLKWSFHITRDVKVSLSSRVYSVQRLNLTLLLYLSAQAHWLIHTRRVTWPNTVRQKMCYQINNFTEPDRKEPKIDACECDSSSASVRLLDRR